MKNKEYKEIPGFKRMVLFVECGVGTKQAEAYLVPEDADQKYLDDYSWERAVQHAESYGIYPKCDMPDDFDEEESDVLGEEYSEDIGGWWEEYDEDEHKGQLIYGPRNDFTWNYM